MNTFPMLSCGSDVDTHKQTREDFILRKLSGRKNDFYLRLRDCFMIWNSRNSLTFESLAHSSSNSLEV